MLNTVRGLERKLYILDFLSYILIFLTFSRSHRWIFDGVLAPQPDLSFHDGHRVQV